MIYTYDKDMTEAIDSIRDSLASAVSFIFERTPVIQTEAPGQTGERAGSALQFHVEGSIAVGSIAGKLRFTYMDYPQLKQADIEFIELFFYDLGWSKIPMTSESSIYDAVLNKHKLLTAIQESKPIRMERVSKLCQELKESVAGAPAEYAEKVTDIANKIIKEIQ